MTTYPTYLEYACAPNVLPGGQTEDLLVVATLKTESQLGVELESATITQIVLDFGEVGSGATDLTDTALTISNIQVPDGWTPTVTGGVTCTIKPKKGTAGTISTNALVVTIKSVKVNSALGNVTLTIEEAATPAPQTNGEPPPTTTTDPGVETITLTKVATGPTQPVLTADPEFISAGKSTTLSWSGGGASDTYSLHYIIRDSLTTITKHADGTNLGADDVYPNADLQPPDPDLVLESTANFILRIKSKDGDTYVTTPVIVGKPDIYANSLHVPYPLGSNENGLLVGDKDGLNGNYGGVAIVCDGAASAYPLAIINSEGDAVFTVDQSANTNAKSFSGFGIVPIGSIITFAAPDSRIPDGWLLCNGQLVSRKKYPDLWIIIGALYGSGDGSTTFNLPDLRGMFLRGVDDGAGRDPDSHSRLAQKNSDGGTGSGTGDYVGSRQADEYASHDHLFSSTGGYQGGNQKLWEGTKSGGHADISKTAKSGGKETRPQNVYVNFIIRAL
jgi:hypothetical protein